MPLIAGIQSDGIRTRLLELNDDKASLEYCLALASAIEVSTQLSKDFNPYNNDNSVYAAAISKEPETPKDDYIAVSRGSHKNPGTSRPYSKPCQFCGGNWHPRKTCPAGSDACHNSKKNIAIGQSFIGLHRTERTLSHLFYVQLKPIHQSWMSTLMASEAYLHSLILALLDHSFLVICWQTMIFAIPNRNPKQNLQICRPFPH